MRLDQEPRTRTLLEELAALSTSAIRLQVVLRRADDQELGAIGPCMAELSSAVGISRRNLDLVSEFLLEARAQRARGRSPRPTELPRRSVGTAGMPAPMSRCGGGLSVPAKATSRAAKPGIRSIIDHPFLDPRLAPAEVLP